MRNETKLSGWQWQFNRFGKWWPINTFSCMRFRWEIQIGIAARSGFQNNGRSTALQRNNCQQHAQERQTKSWPAFLQFSRQFASSLRWNNLHYRCSLLRANHSQGRPNSLLSSRLLLLMCFFIKSLVTHSIWFQSNFFVFQYLISSPVCCVSLPVGIFLISFHFFGFLYHWQLALQSLEKY